jgi:O-antigen biosynthesis protein WbqP
MIRIFDIIFAFLGLILFSPLLLITCVIGYFDTGSPIFIQERMGKNKKPFKLIKFRTMKVGTESVASHLASVATITKLGAIMRRTKIDELPQLINVLTGDMSLVGPRPNLFNQTDLIEERDSLGVYDYLPGITGLAQINNVDMSLPAELASLDRQMLDDLHLKKYFELIFRTLIGQGSGDAIT